MDIYYLREFIALSTLKSFSKVAEELNTTVSSASRHIQTLENEFGVELVVRNTRGVELTKYGEILLPYAKQIIEAQNQCESRFRGLKKEEKSALRIGSAGGPTAALLSNFYLANRDIILDYRNYTETALLDAIELSEIGVGIAARDTIPIEGYGVIPFVTLNYYVTVPAESPLAEKAELTLWDIKDELMILENENSISIDRVLKMFDEQHFTPKAVMRVDRASRTFISYNVGVTISTSERPMDIFVNPRIRMIPLSPKNPVEICVFFKKGRHIGANAKRFINYVIMDWPEVQRKLNQNA